jgi:hypothetical protein
MLFLYVVRTNNRNEEGNIWSAAFHGASKSHQRKRNYETESKYGEVRFHSGGGKIRIVC